MVWWSLNVDVERQRVVAVCSDRQQRYKPGLAHRIVGIHGRLSARLISGPWGLVLHPGGRLTACHVGHRRFRRYLSRTRPSIPLRTSKACSLAWSGFDLAGRLDISVRLRACIRILDRAWSVTRIFVHDSLCSRAPLRLAATRSFCRDCQTFRLQVICNAVHRCLPVAYEAALEWQLRVSL